MFETAELGRKVGKKEFKEREKELRTELLEVQRELEDTDVAVILIISGVEGAGKGQVVNRLTEWLDARGIRTFSFWDESDEERERPRAWRYWRALPERGSIGILFGSWYTHPIIEHAYGRLDDGDYERYLERIAALERMLTDDRALIVKFWFHISRKTQKARLEADLEEKRKSTTTELVKQFAKHFDGFVASSERAIRHTDTGDCPWYVIEATDARYRDLAAGTTLLEAMRRRLAEPRVAPAPRQRDVHASDAESARVTVLDGVDLSARLEPDAYRKQLKRYQARIPELGWKARRQGRNLVAVFEGWDAAGKGGAIRRVTAAMDARLVRVISVAAPTDEEKAHHYLWRFWRHIPRAGYVTIYDRSWYGRVLVERVEKFAEEHEWMRAYREINAFEEQLVEHGTILLKFWVHLSPEEQLRRFEERAKIPWKQHKITDEDWRNRERWADYELAVHDMVSRTSTAQTPWTLIAGDDKRHARVEVVKTFCERLEAEL